MQYLKRGAEFGPREAANGPNFVQLPSQKPLQGVAMGRVSSAGVNQEKRQTSEPAGDTVTEGRHRENTVKGWDVKATSSTRPASLASAMGQTSADVLMGAQRMLGEKVS